MAKEVPRTGGKSAPRPVFGQSDGDIEQRVARAVGRWREQRRPSLAASARRDPPPLDEVLGALSRRQPLKLLRPETTAASPPLILGGGQRASTFATIGRLVVWTWAALLYFCTTLPDLFRGRRAATEHRARQLRRTLERMGGSMLKLGQQLSIRIDLLPLPYCQELSKLLDDVPAFPVSRAIAIVERCLDAPLGTAFRSFDPQPIGSASLACVYQAELHDGRRVAVKVRRPKVAKQFAADFRALHWLFGLAEFLTISPLGLDSIIDDMRRMFEEELDFKKEARFTELFAKRAATAQLYEVTAPKVFFEYSNEEVLVTEFVSGFWLWEILEAVEQNDEAALLELARHGVQPKQVARRLFRASLFGIFDNVIFHADPHPANVVVQPGGRIVLIDFGACGSFSHNQVRLMRQFHTCQANEDTSGMVQCVLGLLEPLPPIDVDTLARRVEAVLERSIRAAKSSNAEWWERTSAGVWIAFMRVVRDYGVRVNLDVLRMIRSTLLYDTIAARLYPDLDIYREYQRYRDRNARRAKKRIRQRMARFAERGFDDRTFLRFEEALDLGRRASYRLQRFLDSPSYRFSLLAGKAVYALSTTIRCAFWLLLVAALGALVAWAFQPGGFSRLPDPRALTSAVVSSRWYWITAALLILVHLRHILIRFGDREV